MTTANRSARATVTTPSDREIRVERIFNAPAERVWRALTDPALVAQWWGRGNKLDIERHEVVRGGHWRYVEHSSSGTDGFEGRYREVVPPERIERTFEWDGMPGHVAVETLTLGVIATRARETWPWPSPAAAAAPSIRRRSNMAWCSASIGLTRRRAPHCGAARPISLGTPARSVACLPHCMRRAMCGSGAG
jgi:uncharacterized protein YndB with AHSA1/START domain